MDIWLDCLNAPPGRIGRRVLRTMYYQTQTNTSRTCNASVTREIVSIFGPHMVFFGVFVVERCGVRILENINFKCNLNVFQCIYNEFLSTWGGKPRFSVPIAFPSLFPKTLSLHIMFLRLLIFRAFQASKIIKCHRRCLHFWGYPDFAFECSLGPLLVTFWVVFCILWAPLREPLGIFFGPKRDGGEKGTRYMLPNTPSTPKKVSRKSPKRPQNMPKSSPKCRPKAPNHMSTELLNTNY